MDFTFTTEPAIFLQRPNRFRITARLQADKRIVDAHCADPGRMRELLIPGATVHLSPAHNPKRKTTHDLRFVEHPATGQLVSLDTRLPNQIFAEGLAQGFFPAFRGFQSVQAEVRAPHAPAKGVRSRFDFRLVDATGHPCWIEIKSVTLVEEGVARFPDAPTTRGRRHLMELAALAQAGERAAVFFIVQRPDACRVEANERTDPDFAQALADAHAAGVELNAAACRLRLDRIELDKMLSVHLPS